MWPGPARADARDGVRAVVVAKDVEAPFARKLRAELTAQGFEAVSFWAPPTPPSGEQMAAIERATDARAVLRLDEGARTIEVWLSEAEGTSPSLVDTVRWAATGPDDQGVAAVQAAETLHAAVLRVEARRGVSGASTDPSASAPDAAKDRIRRGGHAAGRHSPRAPAARDARAFSRDAEGAGEARGSGLRRAALTAFHSVGRAGVRRSPGRARTAR